jgi:hypothetical protein
LAAEMFKGKMSLKSGFGYKFLSKIWLVAAQLTVGQKIGVKRLFGVRALILCNDEPSTCCNLLL